MKRLLILSSFTIAFFGCSSAQQITIEDQKTFQSFLKEADEGEEKSQYIVGIMYSNGIGTEMNQEKAMSWFKKAADKNLPEAEYSLGYYLLENGDIEDSKVWLYKSAFNNVIQAQYIIGLSLLNKNILNNLKNDKWKAMAKKLNLVENNIESFAWLKYGKENGIAEAISPLQNLINSFSEKELIEAEGKYKEIKSKIVTH